MSRFRRGAPKPLNLILSKNIPTSQELDKQKIISQVIQGLKYMNEDDVLQIYNEIEFYQPIQVNRIKTDCDRPVINVDGLKFYKSSGQSRQTELKDIWLPYIKCDLGRVLKSEDVFIENPNLINGRENSLLKYKRFINKENALISKWLYYNNPKLSYSMNRKYKSKSRRKKKRTKSRRKKKRKSRRKKKRTKSRRKKKRNTKY